ncbi:hypothetical protein CFP56_034172 [Quercus suber]|uniref:Uncharacterized protein n=1 Tax=Quercus suber TaxID=58331 RepID=A0AAW0LS22_QUESU
MIVKRLICTWILDFFIHYCQPSIWAQQLLSHLGSTIVENGSTSCYYIEDEFDKIIKRLPKFLRGPFKKVFYKLPIKILEEEGPTSIKTKSTQGYKVLSYYSQPNNKPFTGRFVLAFIGTYVEI